MKINFVLADAHCSSSKMCIYIFMYVHIYYRVYMYADIYKIFCVYGKMPENFLLNICKMLIKATNCFYLYTFFKLFFDN